jgi:hypothetical protein
MSSGFQAKNDVLDLLQGRELSLDATGSSRVVVQFQPTSQHV